ncbi:MAG: UDP-glucose 4-epimerase GalE [Desulfohalobiaceae bacterium]
MSKVLVTGGAGYIGSHTVLSLLAAGYQVVVYDNLSTGFFAAVLPPAQLVHGDLYELDKLDALFQEMEFSSIIHFAANIVVPESVKNPLKYYRNNTLNTTRLIELAVKHGIQNFIFSSTAAVYGIPEQIPVPESSPLQPINPYGRSKLMSEWVLQDAARAHPGLEYIILRYFNVAGADPQGRMGQSTPEATHLIKVACETALGKRPVLEIFGSDYPTPDGTGVRDYIHVTDLSQAHVAALQHLEQGRGSEIFNCGYGHGYSVLDIVQAVEKIAGANLPTRQVERRPGDPAELVADPRRLREAFNWQPDFDDIEKIVQTVYAWEQKPRY